MDTLHQQLFDYVREQVQNGVPREYIKKVLLENDWRESEIQETFSKVDASTQENKVMGEGVILSEHIAADMNTSNSFLREGITMDKIIEKFIPLVGSLLLIIGFGYLLYTSAWVHLTMEIRIVLGFFFSVAIIGGSFSFSEKMRYFTDIGIGSGVLLLYGTLIYGSRTTELGTAMIPEVASLFIALIFSIAVSYFALKRNSKSILILGMVGAYITPFVIGQSDVWAGAISFNAYLIYFFAVNLAMFLVGKEISVREIIPLNIIGLFVGVSTLWGLSSSDGITTGLRSDFFSSELFTGILFSGLVIFSIWSILLSSKKFSEKDDGYLSMGYIAPIIWFAFNITNLHSLHDTTVGILYAVISASCFMGWHVLLGTNTRFQHTALYASGLISAFLAVFTFFEEFNVLTSILLAYSSLIFGFLYAFSPGKSERFIGYIIVSFTGSLLSLVHITDAHLQFETVLIVIALIPAISAYFIAKNSNKLEFVSLAAIYSVASSVVASMFILAELIDYLEMDFLLFYAAPLIVLCYLAYVYKVSPETMSHDSRSRMLKIVLFWFAFGFFGTFFTLVSSIYPAPTNVYLLTHTDLPTDWIMIKGIFATAILFVGLWISRKLQLEQVIKRPSFILVIFGFSTLLLIGNYMISAVANDLNVSLEHGGPRAIATTFWWVAIAIFMLYKGIKLGKKYHAEKLLGLLLLGIALVKIILYDISTMEMQNKIIVLMVVGGAILLFSYIIRSKNLLRPQVE